MATYVYETIPQKKGQKPRQFEYVQKMTDPPLTHDPESGLPVRRVIASIISRWTSSAYTMPFGPTRFASRIVNQPLPAPRSATTLPSAMSSLSIT